MNTMKTMTTCMMVMAALAATGTASARDESDVTTCVPDPGNLSAVVCTIASGESPSTFLGAFAADNDGQGGWTEYYEDSDGSWWVEHHADGSTEVGWDADDFGANYITGPKLSMTNEGTFDKKPRPAVKGTVRKGPRKSYAAAKAAAMKTTGTIAGVSLPASIVGRPGGQSIELTIAGTGKCMATILVQKDGKRVSSSGIVPVTLGTKRAITLPGDAGRYTVEVRGNAGCFAQAKSAAIQVQRVRFGAIAQR